MPKRGILSGRRNLAGRVALVTGASSGIGLAVSRALSRQKANLIITARRAERLEWLHAELSQAGIQVVSTPGDLCDPQFRESLLENVETHFGRLDLLVNNAGMGGIGNFASATPERLRQIMEINFFAPAELLRSALPLLRRSDDAVVVNVGSVLGHVAVPMKSEYCASKFAMHGLTDALRPELARERIDVMMISPSTTATEFFDQALRSPGKHLATRGSMTTETVARRMIDAIRKGRRETILSLGGRLIVLADRMAPGLMSRIMTRLAR